jgi:hypothetical protein
MGRALKAGGSLGNRLIGTLAIALSCAAAVLPASAAAATGQIVKAQAVEPQLVRPQAVTSAPTQTPSPQGSTATGSEPTAAPSQGQSQPSASGGPQTPAPAPKTPQPDPAKYQPLNPNCDIPCKLAWEQAALKALNEHRGSDSRYWDLVAQELIDIRQAREREERLVATLDSLFSVPEIANAFLPGTGSLSSDVLTAPNPSEATEDDPISPFPAYNELGAPSATCGDSSALLQELHEAGCTF